MVCRHVARAALFGDEATAGTQRGADTGRNGAGPRQPMQRRIREDAVELAD